MKFLLLLVMTLLFQRGIKSQEVDIIGEKPFSYDGPFKR